MVRESDRVVIDKLLTRFIHRTVRAETVVVLWLMPILVRSFPSTVPQVPHLVTFSQPIWLIEVDGQVPRPCNELRLIKA